jgi:hypothetical protein
MDREIDRELNDKVAEFKNVAWENAVETLNSYLDSTDMTLFDFYAPYRVSMELLNKNEPLFRLTFFFRKFPPNNRYPYWHVMLSVSLHKEGMEMSGLEKRYSDLDKDIIQIKGADIYHMVKSLIRTYNQTG